MEKQFSSDNSNVIKKIMQELGVENHFAEKLLHIEKLTMLAKKEGELEQKGELEKHETLLDTDLPGSMGTTVFVLRNLLVSLSSEELNIVKNYMKDDFWFPSEFNAGSY